MSGQHTAVDARHSSKWFQEIPAKLELAMQSCDLDSTEAFAQLSELASAIDIDGIEIDYDSIVLDGENFIAPGTIYVKLVYDPNSNDPVEIFDAYPVNVTFSTEEENVEIVSVEADVSSFYK